MFFKKKAKKDEVACPNCRSAVTEKFRYCPYCGQHLLNSEREMKEFGMLGRSDIADEEIIQQAFTAQMTMADRLLGSLMNALMKSLNSQMRGVEAAEVAIQVMHGVNPADIPFAYIKKTLTIVHLGNAKALNMIVPDGLANSADKVIRQ